LSSSSIGAVGVILHGWAISNGGDDRRIIRVEPFSSQGLGFFVIDTVSDVPSGRAIPAAES
jgi:hypothetical protein